MHNKQQCIYHASGHCASIESLSIILPHLEYRLFRFGKGFANDINWSVPTASRGVSGGVARSSTVDLCVIVGAVQYRPRGSVRSASACTPTTGSRCRRLRRRNHCHSQYCLTHQWPSWDLWEYTPAWEYSRSYKYCTMLFVINTSLTLMLCCW